MHLNRNGCCWPPLLVATGGQQSSVDESSLPCPAELGSGQAKAEWSTWYPHSMVPGSGGQPQVHRVFSLLPTQQGPGEEKQLSRACRAVSLLLWTLLRATIKAPRPQAAGDLGAPSPNPTPNPCPQAATVSWGLGKENCSGRKHLCLLGSGPPKEDLRCCCGPGPRWGSKGGAGFSPKKRQCHGTLAESLKDPQNLR